jgi:hypothetical protein
LNPVEASMYGMKRFAVLTLTMLIGSLAALAEQPARHATNPLQAGAGTARPATVKTGSEEAYAKVRQFLERDTDLEASSLVDGKFKIKSADLSGKFANWITAIEAAHGKIWSDCKDKAGVAPLSSLLKNYITALAEEVEEATQNPNANGFLKDSSSKDKATIQVDRLFGLTAGVRALMDKQLASTPQDKQDRLRKQNDELLAMMDKTNAFLAGLDAEMAAEEKAAREKALAPFQEIKLAEIAENGLKAGTNVQSIEQIVEQVEQIHVCWWDEKPISANPGGLISEIKIEESGTISGTTDDKPVAQGGEQPQTPALPAYEYKEKTYGSFSGNYPSVGALNYGAGLDYNLLGNDYKRREYPISDIPYQQPQIPYIPNKGNAAPAPAAAPAAVPVAPVAPVVGVGRGIGAFLPPVSVQTGSFGGGYFPPPMPITPLPAPIITGQSTTTETVEESFTPSPQPLPMPLPQPIQPPTPPTIVNDVNAYIRVNPDGTISTVPNGSTPNSNFPNNTLPTNSGSPIAAPTGSIPVSQPNPNAGQNLGTSNVNAISGVSSRAQFR